MTTEKSCAQPAPGRFWVEYDNDTGPDDGFFVEWWSVIDEQHGSTLCKFDAQADADRIAAMLNGAPIPAPEGAQLPEPAFTLRWDEHSGQYKVNKPGINYAECYTADQMRAALAAPAPQAPVALTDLQIYAIWEQACVDSDVCNEVVRLRSAVPVVRAILNAASRIPAAPQTKEPTNDR